VDAKGWGVVKGGPDDLGLGEKAGREAGKRCPAFGGEGSLRRCWKTTAAIQGKVEKVTHCDQHHLRGALKKNAYQVVSRKSDEPRRSRERRRRGGKDQRTTVGGCRLILKRQPQKQRKKK